MSHLVAANQNSPSFKFCTPPAFLCPLSSAPPVSLFSSSYTPYLSLWFEFVIVHVPSCNHCLPSIFLSVSADFFSSLTFTTLPPTSSIFLSPWLCITCFYLSLSFLFFSFPSLIFPSFFKLPLLFFSLPICLFFHLSVSSWTDLLTLSVCLLFLHELHILSPLVYFTKIRHAACHAVASCSLQQHFYIVHDNVSLSLYHHRTIYSSVKNNFRKHFFAGLTQMAFWVLRWYKEWVKSVWNVSYRQNWKQFFRVL